MQSSACFPLPSILQICSPAQQRAEPSRGSRDYTFSPGPATNYSAGLPTKQLPVLQTAPIVVLYEALQTATSPLADASPVCPAAQGFGLPAIPETKGAEELPAAARQKESFESSTTRSSTATEDKPLPR
ncbi:unnamed protein product, partial [Effrenium voratum]